MTGWVNLAGIYLVVWWIVLFAVLPFGVRTQDETDETLLGTAGSAPVRPMLVRKALVTTAIAAFIVGLGWYANTHWGLTLEFLTGSPR